MCSYIWSLYCYICVLGVVPFMVRIHIVYMHKPALQVLAGTNPCLVGTLHNKTIIGWWTHSPHGLEPSVFWLFLMEGVEKLKLPSYDLSEDSCLQKGFRVRKLSVSNSFVVQDCVAFVIWYNKCSCGEGLLSQCSSLWTWCKVNGIQCPNILWKWHHGSRQDWGTGWWTAWSLAIMVWVYGLG